LLNAEAVDLYQSLITDKSKKREIIILLLCILLGFALRLYTFDKKSLWIDEIYTFNDSKDGLIEQLKLLNETPVDFIHPPLFFCMTHLFYPFDKPERDLRIIPLIFGVLSIPIIYFLSRLFSPSIALPCTVSLSFMTYHVALSQDGRFYSALMLLGMIGVYLFMKHLITLKKSYLILSALFFALSFYTSYGAIPFIIFSQMLWFYQMNDSHNPSPLSSLLILNAFILLFCLPWLLFIVLIHHKAAFNMDITDIGPLWSIISNMFNDWAPFLPLTTISAILLTLFPILSKNKRNAVLLLGILVFPVLSIYFICKLTGFQHFFSSRYVINFLPFFFISIFLSIDSIENKFEQLGKCFSLKVLFITLFLFSNMIILPSYYRGEKQDLRSLVHFLKSELREGDKIYVNSGGYVVGMLHYFGIHPKNKYHNILLQWKEPDKKTFESYIPLIIENKRYAMILYSNKFLSKYVEDGNRLWIVAGTSSARDLKEDSPCVLKGFFDGSFSNFRRFPSDASMYLFLYDPTKPNEKNRNPN
jgi:hypothetical protein